VRAGLPSVKKSERIKVGLQKGGLFTIFNYKINYLQVNINIIDLYLDKIEKMPIISLETRERIEFLDLAVVFLLLTNGEVP